MSETKHRPTRRLIKFICEHAHYIVTICRVEGVVAPELSCSSMMNNDCPGTLRQILNEVVTGQPDYEWRKPRGSESTEAVEYLANGGLLIYPVDCFNAHERFISTLTNDPETKRAYKEYLGDRPVIKSTYDAGYRGVLKGSGRSRQE